MSSVIIAGSSVDASGEGGCASGWQPNPSIDDFPLLVASQERGVFTEDGRATVKEIARAYPDDPRFGVLATKFGTSHHHVAQAIQYAVRAGLLD